MAQGMGHRLGVAAAALGLLIAGSQLQAWLPTDDEDPGSEPFVRTAGIGEEVDLRTARVTVDSVEGSDTVREFGTEEVSPGLWVVAHYTVVAARETTTVSFAELADARGRLWTMTGRNTNLCAASPPGVPVHCSVRAEVPADALPTLRLRLARESLDTRYDVVAEVDLELTAEDVEAFEAAAPVEIPAPSVGGEVP
jgi:hypothetical protein